MRHLALIGLATLAACDSRPAAETPATQSQTETLFTRLPSHPIDDIGVLVHVPFTDAHIGVLNADGEPVDFVQASHEFNEVTWEPSVPLAGGWYTVTEVFGEPADEAFEVVPYGQDPDFPGLQAGDAWRIDTESGGIPAPIGVGPLLMSQFPPDMRLWIEVTASHEDSVDFRVGAQDGSGVCSLHTGTATVSPTGLIVWQNPELPIDAFDEPGTLHDGSLVLGYLDGELGGIQLDGTFDVGVWSNGDICDVFGAVGVQCEPCPNESDSNGCVDVRLSDFTASPIALPWPTGTALSPCLVADPTPGDPLLPPIECEPISCSTHGSGASWVFLPILGLVIRMRSVNTESTE